MAKLLLTALYPSRLTNDHQFPLSIWMHLVLEIDSFFNQKGPKNVETLQACQNSWSTSKLIFVKAWEISMLDLKSDILKLMLWQAIMTIWYPTNKKFALFHFWLIKCSSIAICWLSWNGRILCACHDISFTSISPVEIHQRKRQEAGGNTAKWFKPESWVQAEDEF